jgi:hypothetical protein
MSTWIVVSVIVLGALALGYFASRSDRDDNEYMEGAQGVRIRRYPQISSTHNGFAISWNVRDILYGPNRGNSGARDGK